MLLFYAGCSKWVFNSKLDGLSIFYKFQANDYGKNVISGHCLDNTERNTSEQATRLTAAAKVAWQRVGLIWEAIFRDVLCGYTFLA